MISQIIHKIRELHNKISKKSKVSINISNLMKSIILNTAIIASIIICFVLVWFLSKNKQIPSVCFSTNTLPTTFIMQESPGLSPDHTNIVIEDNLINEDFYIKFLNEEIMMPYALIKKYLDYDILYEEESSIVTVTTREALIRFKLGSNVVLVNNKPITIESYIIKEKNEILLPINFLKNYYHLKISRVESNNLIMIDFENEYKGNIALITNNDTVLRKGASISEPIVQKLVNRSGSEMKVYDEQKNKEWVKARSTDGLVGYILKKDVEIVSKTATVNFYTNNDIDKNQKIIMAWDMVYEKRFDFSKINKMEGLDIISPTWFQLSDEKGNFIDRSYEQYVKWAHGNGYKVWALFSNNFKSPEMTSKFLNSIKARDYTINTLLAKCEKLKIEGINIDFEMVNKKDAKMLSQLIREITPIFRDKGMVVSVDVPVLERFFETFDKTTLKSIKNTVDYIIMMGYDQHWAGSETAGSIAQLTWVENNLKKLISIDIPPQKIILGIPFYTRLWEEKKIANKKTTFVAKSFLSMTSSKKMLKQSKFTTKWDNISGQFYGELVKGNLKQKIWIEDENSVDLRASLIHKYNIQGISAWSRGYETTKVWDVLKRNLKEFKTYAQWQSKKTEHVLILD